MKVRREIASKLSSYSLNETRKQASKQKVRKARRKVNKQTQ